MSVRLVSFSLYGTDPKYLQGAVQNALLMPSIYPDWTMRVYHADDVDVTELKRLGCQTEPMGLSHEHSGMLWRFMPAWEMGVERAIFRDTDSRINVRERAAVDAWVASGKTAHCMHDHEHHRSLPLFGGMWGVRGEMIPYPINAWTRLFSGLQRRVDDMHLMRLHILPLIEHSLLRHSSVKVEWPSEPFPPHPEWKGFVGQQVEADGTQIWP